MVLAAYSRAWSLSPCEFSTFVWPRCCAHVYCMLAAMAGGNHEFITELEKVVAPSDILSMEVRDFRFQR